MNDEEMQQFRLFDLLGHVISGRANIEEIEELIDYLELKKYLLEVPEQDYSAYQSWIDDARAEGY